MENLLNIFAELLKSGNLGNLFGKSGDSNVPDITSLLPILSSLTDNKKGAPQCVTPETISKELDTLIRSRR